MNDHELTPKEMQLHSTDAWNKNYERYEKGNWIGIQYPTEVLVSFVSNLRKYNADAETYFQDSGKEHSIRNDFSGRALEIGFGPIANLKMVSDKGFECHGLEVSKEAVIRGENAMAEQGIKNIKLKLWEPNLMPFDNDYFSLVFGNQSIYFNLDLEAVVNEVFRVLKPGGYFLFSFFSERHDYMKYIEHVRNGIVRFGTNHPNPRLRGVYLRFLKSPEELKILFAKFKDVKTFTVESDQTPLFSSWRYVTGVKP